MECIKEPSYFVQTMCYFNLYFCDATDQYQNRFIPDALFLAVVIKLLSLHYKKIDSDKAETVSFRRAVTDKIYSHYNFEVAEHLIK